MSVTDHPCTLVIPVSPVIHNRCTMHKEMPKLYSDDWVGDIDCNQEILNDTQRNKVIVYRPFNTLFASFVVKNDASTDTWIAMFAEKIKQSWTVMMVASEPSNHQDKIENEVEFVIDVKKKDDGMITLKSAYEFGHVLIESLSHSDITLYSEYVLYVKVA